MALRVERRSVTAQAQPLPVHEEREAEQGVLVTKGQLIEAAEKLCTEQRFKPLDAHVRAKGEEGGARCPAFHQMAELMNDGLVKYRARKHEYLQLMRAANDGKLSRVSLYDKG